MRSTPRAASWLMGLLLLASCAQPAAPPTPATTPPAAAPTPLLTRAPTIMPTALPTATPAAAPGAAQFTEASCGFTLPPGRAEGRNVRCGTLAVPADRDDPGGPTIAIAVAVFAALGPSPRPDPVVFLDGGPGGRTLGGTSAYFDQRFAADLQASHDLVLFDQRGVGLSQPALDCPEYIDAIYRTLDQPLTLAEIDARDAAAFDTCLTRLRAEGTDVGWFSSAASAADVHDLMLALGYEEWNLLGVSYGTRLALTIMRDQPEGVRSVVLDSVYPPHVNRYIDLPGSAQRAFDTLFAGCAADPACAAAYPDLQERFYRMVEQLNQQPARAQVQNVFDGKTYPVLISGDQLLSMLFTSLYLTDFIPDVPRLIDRADRELAQGDTSALGEWGWVIFLFEGISYGAYYAVECSEEAPFARAAALSEAAGQVRPAVGRLYGDPAFLNYCPRWAPQPPDPRENQPVQSSIPTLLLSGEYDPVTPPAYAQRAAEGLTNARVIQFPGLGHATFTQPCPLRILTDFLDDPAPQPVAACLSAMGPPPFRTDR
jgi:pimeloyl-ACP methyl ester carboxylesterase